MQQGRELRKFISDLDDARHRRAMRAWKAEGSKCAGDLLGFFPCRLLIATAEWMEENTCSISADSNIIAVTPREIARMSRLQSPPPVIAVFDMPQTVRPAVDTDELLLAIDTVQDPGNLGTIIRTADWLGVRHIIASRETADCFGPKVVMATMGALGRVNLHYTDNLADELRERRTAGTRILGTFLDGDNLYSSRLPRHGEGCVLVMGNEGRGISPAVAAVVTDRLLIPPYPSGAVTSESLNVATATAIILSHLRFAR